jgi:hypothetical protein
MQPMFYVGLDVHKRAIRYCVKDGSGAIHSEGSLPATRFHLDRWMKTLPQRWSAATLRQTYSVPSRRSERRRKILRRLVFSGSTRKI